MKNISGLMTTNVVSVQESDGVEEVGKKMLAAGHHSLPVVDGSSRVTGIITERDLIDAHRQVHLPTVISILDSVIPISGMHEYTEELRKVTAVDAQGLATKRHLQLARPEESVDAVADRMFEHHLHALPVVDADGKLLGMVSRSDILRGLLAQS
ncbi:CBS domain-containing protein [Acidithiobacillus sp. IBUN Pt1247-S3]|uniref:CBS domain-containing protein n=1 Tax=Acidithiobacillus sp. IBUN Pt1247-S3 TaxID=3166642 RepID=UPI0034E4832D